MNQISLSFNAFQKDFAADISPFYEAHENSFDFAGIHGRKHISRAIVFGECIARYYAKHFGLRVDFEAVRTAIAFHDAGREGNGRDLWEAESAALCLEYLQQKNKPKTYCSQVANFISQKEEAHSWGQIVHDADVLEIMRLFCNTPNGLQKFRTGELFFLSYKDVLLPLTSKVEKTARNQVIEEAWSLIRTTEEAGTIRISSNYLQDLVAWIGENEAKFPFIWECLFKE